MGSSTTALTFNCLYGGVVSVRLNKEGVFYFVPTTCKECKHKNAIKPGKKRVEVITLGPDRGGDVITNCNC